MHVPEPLKRKLAELSQPTDSTVRSYLTLRKLIGILGVALPFVMVLGAQWVFHDGPQRTISDYYYTGMRDVFVGILWAIGIFMVCYKGTRELENKASNLAGACAILVSLFPTTQPSTACPVVNDVSKLHYAFAVLFFLTITLMALFLFKNRGDRSRVPNAVYRFCGGTMAACLLWMLIAGVGFWAEAIAVVAFGIAWLVDGIGGLKDPRDRPQPGKPETRSAFA